LDPTNQAEITEVGPSEAREKTYIQLIAPNTKAAKSWLYEGWPKTTVQGTTPLASITGAFSTPF